MMKKKIFPPKNLPPLDLNLIKTNIHVKKVGTVTITSPIAY